MICEEHTFKYLDFNKYGPPSGWYWSMTHWLNQLLLDMIRQSNISNLPEFSTQICLMTTQKGIYI